MAATRRLTAILAADVAGYSRLMGADEEGTLDRLKAHRRELIDPKIARAPRPHRQDHRRRPAGRSSPASSTRCAAPSRCSAAMVERNAGIADDRRIQFRIGINLGDVIVDGGDIFGDGVNIAARLEALAEPGGICISRHGARPDPRPAAATPSRICGEQSVKNIARPVRVLRARAREADRRLAGAERCRRPPPPPAAPRGRLLIAALAAVLVVHCRRGLWWLWRRHPAPPGSAKPAASIARPARQPATAPRLSIVVLPFANLSNDPGPGIFRRRHHRGSDDRSVADRGQLRDLPQYRLHLQGQGGRREADRPRARRALCARRQRPALGQPGPHQRPADRCRNRRASVGRTVRPRQRRSVRHGERDHRPDRPRGARPAPDRRSRPQDRPSRRARLHPARPRGADQAGVARRLGRGDRDVRAAPWRSTRRPPRAQTGLASALVSRVLDEFSGSPTSDLQRAEELLGRALATSPRSAWPHYVRGQLLRAQGRCEDAIPEYEAAIAIDRNSAPVLCLARLVQIAVGRGRQGDPARGAGDPAQPAGPRDRRMVWPHRHGAPAATAHRRRRPMAGKSAQPLCGGRPRAGLCAFLAGLRLCPEGRATRRPGPSSSRPWRSGCIRASAHSWPTRGTAIPVPARWPKRPISSACAKPACRRSERALHRSCFAVRFNSAADEFFVIARSRCPAFQSAGHSD